MFHYKVIERLFGCCQLVAYEHNIYSVSKLVFRIWNESYQIAGQLVCVKIMIKWKILVNFNQSISKIQVNLMTRYGLMDIPWYIESIEYARFFQLNYEFIEFWLLRPRNQILFQGRINPRAEMESNWILRTDSNKL